MVRRLGYARRAAVLVGLATVLFAVLTSPGCRNATQVTVELRTVGSLTCAQLKGVAIVVAGSPGAAEDRMRLDTLSAQLTRGECGADDHLLGTLVLTPSGSSGAIVVRARISDAPESTCTPPDYKGCIVSRRAFSFVDHTGVTLPIDLELSCLDVPCDVVTSCRTGTCVSSATNCSEATSVCESGSEPVIAPDGAALPPDGAPEDGASSDGAITDGPRGDGAIADASSDSDAAKDASDGGSGQTDKCLYEDLSDPDCKSMDLGFVCCGATTGWMCTNPLACPPGRPSLSCTGAARCLPGTFCCGNPMGGGSSSCAAGCAFGFLCAVDADCPPPMKCNQPGPIAGTRTQAVCGP